MFWSWIALLIAWVAKIEKNIHLLLDCMQQENHIDILRNVLMHFIQTIKLISWRDWNLLQYRWREWSEEVNWWVGPGVIFIKEPESNIDFEIKCWQRLLLARTVFVLRFWFWERWRETERERRGACMEEGKEEVAKRARLKSMVYWLGVHNDTTDQK